MTSNNNGSVEGLDDWVLAPRVPTEAMIRAGFAADDGCMGAAQVYAAMLASTPTAPTVEAWRSIDSAPKDGARLLLVYVTSFGPRVMVGRWDDDRYAKNPKPYWTGDAESIWGRAVARKSAPTHWMSLPQPPAAPTNQQEAGDGC
jgi:hypothetical protein